MYVEEGEGVFTGPVKRNMEMGTTREPDTVGRTIKQTDLTRVESFDVDFTTEEVRQKDLETLGGRRVKGVTRRKGQLEGVEEREGEQTVSGKG